MSATALLTDSLANFLNIYLLLIFVRILLSWFQTAGWAQQAMSFLSPVTDPYLNIFRSFIPPLGGIDLSPILAIFSLQIISGLLTSVA
ncbi:YggT family protein [Dactylococcopsis salina]|uniref:Integral membrane protein n=1 Tax=Dactylococcopsis salina (strain PCC 8305) TaxID=13035 RepID=K9YSJ3_DACS8|nr:YggT family protein [Dactylococcopsis salina]AFZ49911.1 putative integral membrane protein [Dactylococcopsis salina PCC 8305]